jgi:NAD(P)-dependent dehydrogenase (short-subunit alcohol dehydrogenase family)
MRRSTVEANQFNGPRTGTRLKDRVVLITGGGTGIGRASAEACAAHGALVALAGRRPEPLEEAALAIRDRGGSAIAITGDVGVADDAARMVRETLREFKQLDVLVNCAGQELVANVVDTSEEWWDRVIDTNLKGVYLLSREALPHMIERQSGVIINVASQLAFVGAANFAAYTASKGGVINLTRSMALDHAKDRIRVNALCPGAVDTPLLRRQFEDSLGPQGTLEDLINLHPVGRLGRPEEIACATVFLASDESSFMTGSMLVMDGGYIAW